MVFFNMVLSFISINTIKMQYHCRMKEHSIGEDMTIDAGSNFLPTLINY